MARKKSEAEKISAKLHREKERAVVIAAGYVAVARADIARLREEGRDTSKAWDSLDRHRGELAKALESLGCGHWRPA